MRAEWEQEVSGFLTRATRGLAPDAELRQEVKRELRAHLEDTAAQRRATGASAGEARAYALRAFGDPDEVSAELRAANLGRMRVRATLKWTARLTLGPAAALVTLALLLYAGESVSGLWRSEHSSALTRWLAERAERRSVRGDLSAAERFLLTAGPEEMAAKYPENPVYFAAYVRRCCFGRTKKSRAELLALLDRGERLDPDNAFYNYMKAALLLEAGAQFDADPTRAYSLTQRGRTRTQYARTVAARDRELVAQALEELGRGSAKPSYSPHTRDFVLACQRLRREPQTLGEEVARVFRITETPVPHVARLRGLVRGAIACAALSAGEGQVEAARNALADACMAPLKCGASAVTVSELLGAERARVESLYEAALVYEKLGDGETARGCRAEAELVQARSAEADRCGPLRFSAEELEKSGAFFFNQAAMIAPVKRNRELLRAWRMSERVVFERAAMTGVLLFGLAGLACLGLRSCWSRLRSGGEEDGPRLLFIGWRRLLLVLAWSVVLPLGGYYVWTRLTPFGRTEFGTRYCADRMILELVVFGMALPAITLAAGYWAIRARCAEAGMLVPRRDVFRPGAAWRVAVGLAGAAVVGYALVWERPGCRGRAGFYLAALLMGMGALWLVLSSRKLALLPGGLGAFRRTFARSFAPLLALAIVLVGAVGHTTLGFAERRHVAAMQSPGWRLCVDEVEMSSYDEVRRRFVEQHAAALARGGEAQVCAPCRSVLVN